MSTRPVRIGIAALLLGFLLVFFLPMLPYDYPAGTCGGATYCTGVMPGGSGYQAIGRLLTGWGATSSAWFQGYVPPTISYGGSTLTAGGELFSVVIPIVVACAWLFAPELVRISKVTRIGFAAFGASLFGLSDLMLISMMSQGQFPIEFILLGSFFGVSGVLMLLYGMRAWPLGLWNREEPRAIPES